MIHVSEPTLSGNEGLYLMECLRHNQLSQGAMVDRFERDFAEFVGAGYAVAVSSGTAALHLTLAALGIGPGDEVVVPDFTFVATANAVAYTGAKVVLADVFGDTWTLRDGLVYQWALPVHLFGQKSGCSGDAVIEDSAECLDHGPLKSRAACYSFYGNKVIITGEGGMVVTNDADLAKRARFLRSQAMSEVHRYYHRERGFNYRMTDLQAAVGLAQLERADALLARRREIAALYREHLPGFTFQGGERSCHWMVAISVPYPHSRDMLAKYLAANGVETRPGFVPLHMMPMYRSDESFPVSDSLGHSVLCLPTHANLTDEQVVGICELVKRALYD